jgi:hypothetical protein
VRRLAAEAAGWQGPMARQQPRPRPPRLTENWFC